MFIYICYLFIIKNDVACLFFSVTTLWKNNAVINAKISQRRTVSGLNCSAAKVSTPKCFCAKTFQHKNALSLNDFGAKISLEKTFACTYIKWAAYNNNSGCFVPQDTEKITSLQVLIHVCYTDYHNWIGPKWQLHIA